MIPHWSFILADQTWDHSSSLSMKLRNAYTRCRFKKVRTPRVKRGPELKLNLPHLEYLCFKGLLLLPLVSRLLHLQQSQSRKLHLWSHGCQSMPRIPLVLISKSTKISRTLHQLVSVWPKKYRGQKRSKLLKMLHQSEAINGRVRTRKGRDLHKMLKKKS